MNKENFEILYLFLKVRYQRLIKLLGIIFLPHKTFDFIKYKINKYKEEFNYIKQILPIIKNLKKLKQDFKELK